MLSQKTWLILRESQGVRLEEFSGIHSPFLQTKKLAVTHNMIKIDLKILNFWKSCLTSIKGQRKWNFMMSKKFSSSKFENRLNYFIVSNSLKNFSIFFSTNAPTISFIFWDFSIFYQIFLSTQVKRWPIITYMVYTSCFTSCRTN